MRGRGGPGVLLALLLLATPGFPVSGGALSAQGAQAPGEGAPATLDAVEAAMDGARFEEARRILERWWERGESASNREERQRGLWLRGKLTVDPDGAELLYRRLVLEYPGGEWSDQALLRLARGAEARREPEAATRFLEILIRDYPLSPHRVEARAHLDRLSRGGVGAGGAPLAARPGDAPSESPRPAEPRPAEPRAAETPPVETLPTERPAQPDPAAPVPVADASGPFTLQFGAFGSESGARSVAAELRGAGLDVRIVRVEGSPLYRVRMGGWADRALAEAQARELGVRGFEVMVSTDREQERPPG